MISVLLREKNDLLSLQFASPMDFQTAGARHTVFFCRAKPRNLAEHFWNPCGSAGLWNPGGILVWNPVKPQGPDHRTALAEPCGNPEVRMNQVSNHDHPAALTAGGTLVEPHHGPPSQPLVECCAENGGTLVAVEPYLRAAPTTPEPGPKAFSCWEQIRALYHSTRLIPLDNAPRAWNLPFHRSLHEHVREAL